MLTRKDVSRIRSPITLRPLIRRAGGSKRLRVLAARLAHLGEVEARGLYRLRACSSLYAYSIYELRLPEDEAVRRVAAARALAAELDFSPEHIAKQRDSCRRTCERRASRETTT